MPHLLLAILLAGQSGTGQVTALSPADAVRRPTMPAATMTVEPVAMALAAWDRDGDGRTTRAEMEAGVARSFVSIAPPPATSFSYIGYSDWAQRFLGDRHALPSPFEIDADGDDRITPAELQAAIARAFDRFDLHHDGVVTRTELLTIRAGVGGEPERGGKRGRRAPR